MQKNLGVKRSFRCTDTMWEDIIQQSNKYGITPSEYIRRAIDSYKGNKVETIYTQQDYLMMKEYISATSKMENEIHAIGVNINQIVKNHNAHFYLDYEKKKLFALLQELINLVKEYATKKDIRPMGGI